MKIEVIKYYSVGTYRNVVSAAKKVEESQKRHPDREYTILTNTRGYVAKFSAVQVKTVTVDLPMEEDLNLPPAPERPAAASGSQQWNDWEYENKKRREAIYAAQRPALSEIKRKMNP